MPTVVVLLMVAGVEAFSDQLLIFGLAMLVVGSFAGPQKAVFGWYKKQV
jgi:hypothetical protein